MRPIRLVHTAVNPESSSIFCLVECEETPRSKSPEMDVVLLEMHCVGKAHGIIKLDVQARPNVASNGPAGTWWCVNQVPSICHSSIPAFIY